MGKSMKGLLGIILAVSASAASAGTFGNGTGKILDLVAGAAGTGHAPKDMIYFRVETMNTGACTSDKSTAYFVIDTKAPGGTAMQSLLMSAKMANKTIWIAGRGTCNTLTNSEDVSYMYIK